MCKLSCIFLIAPLLLSVNCGKQFRLGRSKGGNLGGPGGYNGEKLPPAQWFEQRLDHSSRTDVRTWKQRFFVNDSFHAEGNPVFLMIGGEGPADARWMIKGTWIDYAKVFGALCINLEHRYYGESHPTSDLSIKNLQYLSSYQALADLANFISAMNKKYKLKDGTKWIVFGGSYPGSLAAWMRLKYPHLVFAAVSSSGPLLAKVNFKEYFQVVVKSLREKTGNDDCANIVKQAHQQIVVLIKTNPKIIEDKFKVCKPFADATSDDMKNFYNSLADDFAGLVQYNEDNRISLNEKYKNVTINTVCELLTSPGSEPAYKKLAAFNSIVLEQSNQTCLDYSYVNLIKDLRNVNWSSAEGGRQWMYQTCTEFGFYQTSSGEVDVFGNDFPVDFFIQQCQDIFGKKFGKSFIAKAAQWTNTDYGALNISASRVAFAYGSIDPWHALGLIDSNNAAMPSVYIHGAAHCADMYPRGDYDSPSLTHARRTLLEYLLKWINETA